ncbi:conjugal transfer protein [Listeria monocytogenes]|uniref:conjugal transfer protein n=1 Tax=Listeria seeligeri TaxID=1640 RepID=UPI0018891B63|nr:conjugal transfer protein [Listeria seeligeri]EGL4226904.1 conjugal transfer protein [Listeria monocytogenes]MBF2376064.1 conjugal transfer protein [Listeria seeligeri]
MDKKTFFSQMRKKEKTNSPMPKDKGKFFQTLVWLLLAFIVFLSVVSLLIAVRSADKATVPAQATMKETSNEVTLSETEANYYAKDFVKAYINVPSDTNSRNTRKEKLQQFLIQTDDEATEEYFMVGQNNNERSLKDMALKKSVSTKNGRELVYVVRYEDSLMTSREVEKVVNKKKVKQRISERKVTEQQAEMHIVVVQNKQGLSIDGLPYFSPVTSSQAKITQKSSNKLEQIQDDKSKELQDFTTDFMRKYVELKPADMAYMMKKPEALSGLYAYQSVQHIEIYELDKNTYLVQGLLVMVEKNSKITVSEQFSLTVEKRDGNHYVTKFEHGEEVK